MKTLNQPLGLVLALSCAALAWAQPGPPPFGAGSPRPGGPGPGPGFGPFREKIELLGKFDKDRSGHLDATERKAAREFLQKQRENQRERGGVGPGMGGPREPFKAAPGRKLSPEDVKPYPAAALYDSLTLRTFFLEFENADWENELQDFHNTDVEVPAKLIVDGKSYPDVGVHFRGSSSYDGVRAGQKRSLNLTLDLTHKDQNIGGYHTLNLLNSHDDPIFMRAILFLDVARQYLPAPKANFARVVINGESWGIYDNLEQFNKQFVKENFATEKGARWKVRGTLGGEGRLTYIGEDPAAYKPIYAIKTKDDPKVWAAFIRMVKVLNETPAEKLPEALPPLLDVDGALRFIALDNALINADGYWVKTSDYSIYRDPKGRFHILPGDVNETFFKPTGMRFAGGPGAFGPGMFVGPLIMRQGDKDADQKLSPKEFAALADAWFDKLDTAKAGKVSAEEFPDRLGEIFGPPPGAPPGAQQSAGPGPRPGGGRGFGPGRFIGPGLFTALDGNKDGVMTRPEIKAAFAKWAVDWDGDKAGSLDETKLRTGFNGVLPMPNFGPPGRGGTNAPGPGRMPAIASMPPIKGVEVAPLIAEKDPNKPLISKLLAVPGWRAKYLEYVRDIAEKWLDWEKLGPIAERYQRLLADDVKADTRKLYPTEDFLNGLTRDLGGGGSGPFGQSTIGLKNFADQRRAYLLNRPEIQKLGR